MADPVRLHRPEPLEAGAVLALDADAARYLGTVMRLRPGDAVSVFNPGHGEWTARIAEIDRRGARLVVDVRTREPSDEPGPVLWFAAIKRARLELVVEKAVELGASALRPVVTRRSVVDRLNPARLTAIMTEAAEQCGRLGPPRLDDLRPLRDLLDEHAGSPLYVADETGGGRPIVDALRAGGDGPLLIGPEGGFETSELADLRARDYVVAVDLGPRTLRAETAAIAALACWQAALGETVDGDRHARGRD